MAYSKDEFDSINAHLNPKSLTYGEYLKVPELLDLQNPLSDPPAHDETLFIIIHQVYELWFKQILHEVEQCSRCISKADLMPLLHSLKRIVTIQKVLHHQVDILETMTSKDFNDFRERLNPASGFQSLQFRFLEFRLGVRDERYINFFKNQPEFQQLLKSLNSKPSLYDEFLHLLSKKGMAIPKSILNRDVTEPYEGNEEVEKVIFDLYKNSHRHYDLYMACEALMDVDEWYQLWRYRHVAMVERMVGNRIGTGGSTGVKYLMGTLSKRFFPELWSVRNKFGGDYK